MNEESFGWVSWAGEHIKVMGLGIRSLDKDTLSHGTTADI